MSPTDLSDDIACVQVLFQLTGLSWQSDRVRAWMGRCGFESKHDLTPAAYRTLVKHLRQIHAESKPVEKAN